MISLASTSKRACTSAGYASGAPSVTNWPGSSHDGIDAGDRRDHVGDHAALAHCGHSLQVGERRIPVVHPVRPGAAVADHVHTQLAARRLDGDVDLPGRYPDALGDQL